jgi:hypothetical protein
VSINVTLHSVGELRTDLVAVGQAMANTTAFLTRRIDQVSSDCGGLKQELGQARNMTHMVDDQLHRFMHSFNHSSGNMFSTMTALVDEMNRNTNRTTYLEFGLAGIMNFSLEIDSTLKQVQDNVSGCLTAISDLSLNATQMSVKVEKVFRVHAQQSQAMLEQANHFEGNVSRLTLAANILETELSRVASGYSGLKQILSNQIQSTGAMEVSLQKMTKETVSLKAEVDSLRFEFTSVKSESSGVTVFVTSMQNHVVDLTSNMSAIAANVSAAMSELDDMRQHLVNV